MSDTVIYPQSAAARSLFGFGVFRALLLCHAALVIGFFLLEAVRFLPAHSDNFYPEGSGVLSAMRWASGEQLYADYRQPPYIVTPFPPLWYGCLALAVKAGLTDLDSLTFFGRALTLTCLFLIAWTSYLWNRRLDIPRLTALAAPALYLSFPLLLPWAISARPDLLALLLGILALYLLQFGESTFFTGLAGIVSAAAFLTRHNAVSVPVAAVLWLALRRQWKRSFYFAGAWWAVVGLALVTLEVGTHGLLALNLSGATFGGLALTYARDVFSRALLTPGHGFATVMLILAILAIGRSFERHDQRTYLISIYCLISTALALLGSSARGGGPNHYLEPALSMALLVPSGLRYLEEEWNRSTILAAFCCITVLVILLPAVDMQRSYLSHNRAGDLRAVLAQLPNGAVLSDVPYLAARRSPWQLLDAASMVNVERAGAWSSASIRAALERKEYRRVVTGAPASATYDVGSRYPRAPRWSPDVLAAIQKNYTLCSTAVVDSVEGQSNEIYIYAPVADGVIQDCTQH